MGGILSSVKGIKKVNSAVAGFAEVLISYSLPLEQGILPSASHLLLCGLLCCFGEAEIAIMVIPVIPKRTFLRKLISLLSNWEPQAELCHVLALGAAVRLIPLILSALITTPCAALCPRSCVPINHSSAGAVWGTGTLHRVTVILPLLLVGLE